MPELVLLAVVSLSAMALLTLLFLKLNQTQLSLIQSLTLTNQSLLNQVRSRDIGTLQGLQIATGNIVAEPEYQTVEARELAAYMQAVSHEHEFGDMVFDDDTIISEIENMRSEL
jgi:hypothetical protein